MIRWDPNLWAHVAVNGDTTTAASASGIVAKPACRAL